MKIFVGFDQREAIAFEICCYSIRKYSKNVEILPLRLDELKHKGIYKRKDGETVSTDFAFTRFLVPYLSNFEGYSVFVDCDFLFNDDITKLLDYAEENIALSCVQHNYTPKTAIKMDGQIQAPHFRKNWSSLILWNCAHPSNRVLGTQTIGTATPSWLHQFQWLKDSEIGSIPLEWNFLAMEYEKPDKLPSAIHYTNGCPIFEGYENTDFAENWTQALDEYNQQHK